MGAGYWTIVGSCLMWRYDINNINSDDGVELGWKKFAYAEHSFTDIHIYENIWIKLMPNQRMLMQQRASFITDHFSEHEYIELQMCSNVPFYMRTPHSNHALFFSNATTQIHALRIPQRERWREKTKQRKRRNYIFFSLLLLFTIRTFTLLLLLSNWYDVCCFECAYASLFLSYMCVHCRRLLTTNSIIILMFDVCLYVVCHATKIHMVQTNQYLHDYCT